MKVKIRQEAGYEWALMGMSFSHFAEDLPVDDWWAVQKPKAFLRAEKLKDKDGGHNKFLESIQVWVEIKASRAFWSEFDTYRAGVTKQSTSTMHTLSKRAPLHSDFEEGTPKEVFIDFLRHFAQHHHDIVTLKSGLPEGFLQRRMVCTNYKTIKGIVAQRKAHRYKPWRVFIEALMEQLEHPELM